MTHGASTRSVRFKLPADWRTRPTVAMDAPTAPVTAPQRPPLYKPHPDSLLPLRRCYRTTCRTIKPEGKPTRCPACGAMIDNRTPLVEWFLYIEPF